MNPILLSGEKKMKMSCFIFVFPMLIFCSVALPVAAQNLNTPSIIATYQGGQVSLEQFEDWMDFMDLMYPIPHTQYSTREGWEQEIIRLAQARALALWRKAGIRKLQQPTQIEVDQSRVENLQVRYVRNQLLQPLFEEETRKWNEKIHTFYDEVKTERFTEPPVYEFRHIFINTNPERDGRPESEARERIQLVKDALSSGKTFETIAEQFSDSAPTRRGALLGPVSADQISEEYAQALATLKEGEISPPVETKNGYVFIQLIKKHPETFIPFSQVERELLREIPRPNYHFLIADFLNQSNIPVDLFFPLEQAFAKDYRESTLLFRVGDREYHLGDMYHYFENNPKRLEILMALNFNIEDLDFERFVNLAFFDPKRFNGWIEERLGHAKLLWVGRQRGLFEEPRFKRYLSYLEEDVLSRALGSFHTPQRMQEFDREGEIQVNREALQPFIERYLIARGLSFQASLEEPESEF